ncbi:11899_t:CDS:2 [Diversispora eburnea]|uniref:11899_t:CDS:1 n=1 Tax=Diversispora eburnea TaxID=1213867 RepID=A0A9N9FA18_9GLOM|nr:11899_t:CDS:2 [Diversispora eburnea]
MINILKKNIKNVKYKNYLTDSSFLSNSLSNPIPNSISNSSFISTSSFSLSISTQIKQNKSNTTSDTSNTIKEKISNSSPPPPPPSFSPPPQKTRKWGRIFLLTSSMVVATILFIKLDQKYSNSPSQQQEFNDGSSLLNVKIGGPKMLKIISHLNDENKKPRLIILGSGWGAISVIKELEKDKYHITVISPQ